MLSAHTRLNEHRAQIAQAFCEMFRTMLRMEVYPCVDCPCAEAGGPKCPLQMLTSVVSFEGSWRGVALLECSLDVATLFTNRLMPGSLPPCFDREDVADCLGELTNMIGGNLKGLLPDRVELSVPSVTEGRLVPPADASVIRLSFACRAGTFAIVIGEIDLTDRLQAGNWPTESYAAYFSLHPNEQKWTN